MILEDIYKVSDLHSNRAEQAVAEILRMQLNAHSFEDFEAVKTIDTIKKRH